MVGGDLHGGTPDRPDPADDRLRVDDELIGLDRDDPEVRAFAEHLRATHEPRSAFTVEGYLSGVTAFAASANRSEGIRRWAAVVVVALILLGVLYTVLSAAAFAVSVLL